jgi:transposase-like protein
VPEPTHQDDVFDVECPHCHRRFRSKLLVAQAARHAGFKCPHCRLFVAFERVGESDAPAG